MKERKDHLGRKSEAEVRCLLGLLGLLKVTKAAAILGISLQHFS